MTDLPALFQKVVPHYHTLAAAAEKCSAELDRGGYDSVEHYLELRQSLLDTYIVPLMAQIESRKATLHGTDGLFIQEAESQIERLIRQILDSDRRCMEKVRTEQKVLQATLLELHDNVRTVQGYGQVVSRPPLRVNEEA
jgi:hypothetical protein